MTASRRQSRGKERERETEKTKTEERTRAMLTGIDRSQHPKSMNKWSQCFSYEEPSGLDPIFVPLRCDSTLTSHMSATMVCAVFLLSSQTRLSASEQHVFVFPSLSRDGTVVDCRTAVIPKCEDAVQCALPNGVLHTRSLDAALHMWCMLWHFNT